MCVGVCVCHFLSVLSIHYMCVMLCSCFLLCISGQSVSYRKQPVLTLDPHRAGRRGVGSRMVLFPAGSFLLSFPCSAPSQQKHFCLFLVFINIVCLYYKLLLLLCAQEIQTNLIKIQQRPALTWEWRSLRTQGRMRLGTHMHWWRKVKKREP